MSLLPLIILIPIMYVLLIRPQQRRVAQQRALISSLEVGDRVVTAGGMIGIITELDDATVSLQVAPDTVLTFIRPAVSRRYEEPEAPTIPEPELGEEEE